MKLFLLFASFVLSIYVSAQTNRIDAGLQYPAKFTQENVKRCNEDTGWQTIDANSENYTRQIFNHQTFEQRSLIQIYDSISKWYWHPDSNRWILYSKLTNIMYDENNNLIDKIEQWNENGWRNNLRYIYTYDDNNNQVSFLMQDWNDSVWWNDQLTSYTYDANNNRTSYLLQYEYGNGWENQEKETWTYDSHHNKTSHLFQHWSLGIPELDRLYTYTYDANNNQTSFLMQSWHVSGWANLSLRTSIYDSNNNLTSYLEQDWDDTGWRNWSIIYYTYDDYNNLTNKLTYIWLFDKWNINQQWIFNFDANNYPTGYLTQFWNGSSWDNSEMVNFTYDANNNQTNTFYYGWDDNDSIWEVYAKETYTYDANNNQTSKRYYNAWLNNTWKIEQQYIQSYDDDNFTMGSSHLEWDYASTNIIESDSTHYYYHTYLIINDLAIPSESIKFYPNPTYNQFTIETLTTPKKNTILAIYNISGQALFTCQIKEKQSVVDVSGLSQGIYIVRVSDDRTVIVRKFVKK